MAGWIVQFNCNEAVYREGTRKSVTHPDDLGCPPLAVYNVDEVDILSAWDKSGVSAGSGDKDVLEQDSGNVDDEETPF